MEEQDIKTEYANKYEGNSGKNRKNSENDSLQYNSQDLDQVQKSYTNPVQLNSQDTHVYIMNGNDSLSGKITGITYLAENKKIVSNVKIHLFFGNSCEIPVLRTSSDINGNFSIDDIPPGYYTLYSEHSQVLKYRSHYIKVLPGQKVQHSIALD